MRKVLVMSAALVAAGCQCSNPCNPDDPEYSEELCPPDASDPTPPDFCNTPEEGKANPECLLTLCATGDAGVSAFINPTDGGIPDQDWYSVKLGALTPRSLLH